MNSILKYLKASPSHCKIFMLDDDVISLELMKRSLLKELPLRLKGQTFEFKIFNDPLKGFMEAVKSEKPDFILLDYHIDMEGGKRILGITVLKKLKEEFPEIPVIMLTSEDRLETAIELMREGAEDFVLKSESATINIVKAIGRKTAYIKLFHKSQRNRLLVRVLVLFWVATISVFILMGVLFPAPGGA